MGWEWRGSSEDGDREHSAAVLRDSYAYKARSPALKVFQPRPIAVERREFPRNAISQEAPLQSL